jgi:glycosyltransferase involved in cell wall biosynthesis
MEFQVSILLLNYNGKKFNQACIASILTQTYQHFEILFIDNASTDDSVAEVAHLFQNEIQK